MQDDEELCLCFHVTKRKIVSYLRREDPPVASLLSECLGAGTGCGWCIPFLKQLHAKQQAGELPDLELDPGQYAKQRLEFHRTGERPEDVEP